MTDATHADDKTRCPRCDLVYPADMPGCPRCHRIRQTNVLILTTVVMLALLALVGWFGAQFFW